MAPQKGMKEPELKLTFSAKLSKKRSREACHPSENKKCRHDIPPARKAGDGAGSRNLIQYIQLSQLGIGLQDSLRKQYLTQPYIRSLSSYRLVHTLSPFDRRVTCVRWSTDPRQPTILAASSHGGDIILMDYENIQAYQFIQGSGAGGSITEMKFNPHNTTQIFTSSINGAVALQDFTGRQSKVFLQTDNWERWYCTVDLCPTREIFFAGDNVGNGTLMTTEGKEIFKHRMHKSKLQHAEFNPHVDWLMVTASNDKTVKLWDIRQLKTQGSKCGALHVLKHGAAINSAYFHPSNGSRLLTTSQDSLFQVFDAPAWDRPQLTVVHPHRHFQHLTPIKAQWHPLYNLIVIGRYPDAGLDVPVEDGFLNDSRTIDVFDADNGQLVVQLLDPHAPGIVSINQFSPTGNALASGMGYHVLIWRDEAFLKRLCDPSQAKDSSRSGVSASRVPGISSRPVQQMRSNRTCGKKEAKDKTRVKVKTKKC